MKISTISKILKLLSGNLIFYLLIKDSVFDSNYYPLYDHQETCSLETSSKPWFLLRLWRQDTLKQRKQQSIQNIIISDENVKVSRRWGTPQQPRPLSSGRLLATVTVTMTEMLMGIVLTLLALIGFFFNIYIVLALVLTKQVSNRYL